MNDSGSGRQIAGLGQAASDLVQQAAAILEEEVAAGVVAARRVEQQLGEGRVNIKVFEHTIQRFRRNGHDLVNMIGDRMKDARSGRVDSLVQRFQRDGHEVVDTMTDLVTRAGQLFEQVRVQKARRAVRGKAKQKN